MTQSMIATAADYHDALVTARKAKSTLFLILLLILVGQLALFFVVHYRVAPTPADQIQPAAAGSRPTLQDLMIYLVGLTQFFGIALSIVLAVVLLLIVKIMLVGRLIGVSRVTSAFIWAVMLIVLLFPWQAFLSNATFTSPDFKIPGILFSWTELVARGRWTDNLTAAGILRWARFVGFPLFAIIILLLIQARSTRGLRLALGESEIQPEDTA